MSLIPERVCAGRRWIAPALIAVSITLGACSGPEVEEPAVRADDVVLAYVDGGLDDEVADCFVGLGQREFELAALLPGAASGDDQLLIEEMLSSCEDAVAILAADEPPPPEFSGSGPFNIGDDLYLDELWVACDRGVGAACDELWEEAPVGSIYENFGVTCGGRPEVLDCTEELVPDPVEDLAVVGEGVSG